MRSHLRPYADRSIQDAPTRRLQPLLALFSTLVLLLFAPAQALAQYFPFGKNKVQYDELKWSYMQSKHFDVYYYEGGQHLADFAARTAEEAYLQTERLFDHRIAARIPIIVYQSHNDFAVTNAVNLPTFSEGIAAVTEPYKNRIAIPFVGDYRQFRQTLHHELIHAVINDIYYGGSIQSIIQNNIALRIPHWFNEGLAEYAAEGWSSDADDWLRDATINDHVADIPYIGGFASYQAGQGVWDYIAEQYGQEKIGEILHRLRLTHSVEASFKRATGLTLEEISERWKKTLKEIYYPELGARESLSDFAKKITIEENSGFYNSSPALSPLGDRMAFISSVNGLFDVLIIDTSTGEIIKTLIDGQTSAEYESLRILTPGISWSPDGTKIALAVKSGPSDAIAVVDVDTQVATHYRVPDVDQIVAVSWSPDGAYIAFEAAMDAQSDLFVLDLASHETINYTNDVFSDHEPAWSPDGKYLVFHSDRGSYTELGVYQAATFDMAEHDYGQHDIYLLSLENGSNSNELRRLTYNTTWDDQSARFGSDPDRLLFLSDRNGIFNLYEKELSSGLVRPLTNSLSGLKQISLSADGDEAAIVSLEEGRTLIYLMNGPFNREVENEELPPNVWAQRVMQETIAPAPAITLAPQSKRRDNPFLRDATDGIAYERWPNASSTLLADRLMLLANRSPLSTSSIPDLLGEGEEEGEESVIIARSSWDSTRYGSVNVNFEDYIFADDDRDDDVTRELAFLRDPFEIEGNVDEDGKYIPRRYKLRFSPDLVYGTAGYDALFGVQGITQITFSDMLGDHRVLVASNLLIDLRNSDYMMSYSYLPNRLDWTTSAFHVSRLLPDNNLNTIYRYRQYGLRYNVTYPLDKFRRIDANMSLIGVSQADIIEPGAPAITRTLLYPSLTFTKDVTTPGAMYPINGNRYAFSIAGSPFSFSEGKVRFVTLLGDGRQYIDLGQNGRYTLALRISGGTSLGPTQQLFYTAGVQNWVNRRLDDINGFPIEDISDFILATPIMPLRGYHINARSGTNFGLVNAELRFPLFTRLGPAPLPLLPFYNFEGSVFMDAATVWGGRGFGNPINFFRTNEAGERVFDDMIAGMGFGVRAILLGYPIRLDFAWPYDGQRFGRQRTYISFGFDF